MTDSLRTRCLCTTFAMAVLFHGTAPATAQTLVPQTPQPQVSRAFSGLFRDTVTDFRGLASKKPLTILGIGAVEKVPVVVEGDAIAIRSQAQLALTFDHRLIDGALADQFCQKVKAVLEGWSEAVL